MFQVIVLRVAGVPFETLQSVTGRTEKYTKILRPLIKKKMETVVFFLDIDYDDVTW